MVKIVGIYFRIHKKCMCCDPQPSTIIGDTGRCILDRIFINHISRINYFSFILICHLLNKVIRDTLYRAIVWVTYPDIVPIIGNTSKVAVLIHSQGNHIFSGLTVHHHQFSHTVILSRIGSDQHKIIRQADSLWGLGFAENILIDEIILTCCRHTRYINFIIEWIVKIF